MQHYHETINLLDPKTGSNQGRLCIPGTICGMDMLSETEEMVVMWMNAVSNDYGAISMFTHEGGCPLPHSTALGVKPIMNLEKFQKLASGKWVSTLLIPEGFNPDG